MVRKYFALILVFMALAGKAQVNPTSALLGSWTGKLNVGPASLTLVLHLEQEDGYVKVTLDSPDQGAKGIPALKEFLSDDSLALKVESINMTYQARLKDGKLVGTFAQNGVTIPLVLTKGAPEVKRSQVPQPPFPYKTEEVTFRNEADGATLAGTLTWPVNPKPKPTVVLLVTGSGQQNRDEEVFDHKPFLVIADYLARQGIATLRYDDRGTGASVGGEVANATTEDFMRDAAAGLDYLRGRNDFGKVGILGHSEGGMIAFMLGAKGKTDFIVSLAGPGVKGDTLLAAQGNRILAFSGQPANMTVEKYRQQDAVQKVPWLKWFIDYDPSNDIRQTCCPVFALNGSLDCQVISSLNLEAIRRLLPSSEKNLVKEYPSLNHLFQHSITGLVAEYGQIEETISPEVLSDMAKWIQSLEVGQKPQQPKRKKVAVVLSGGGAKGMAHIGVLKVLERAGIPIDIITGTSMGSLIGGIYACGHRANEIDSLVRCMDWGFVLTDREDLRHQSLREREKQNTYVISKDITFGKAAKTTGGGFISGKNVASLIDTYTSPYLDSIDFNKLPIPFACVATDIVDYSEQVFHSGIIGRAMRASMSIPGVFAPVRTNDRVLVDGGLTNNFPVDIAREMGADYVIGVDVQSELRTASELNSTSSILLQIVDYNCLRKYQDNIKLTDTYIYVNPKGYSSASFNATAVDTLIRRGEDTAMEHWDELIALREKLGIDSSDSQHITEAPATPVVNTSTRYKIGELRFIGMSGSDETYIRRKFRLHVGDSIDRTRADFITTAIRQDLYYQTASFRIVDNTDHSSATLVFIAGPKRTNTINVGARFDNEEMVAMQANAELPIRSKVPMDMEITLRLGKRLKAQLDWAFHPISFFRPTVSYAFHNNDIDFYEFGDKLYNITYNQHNVALKLFNFNIRNLNINIGANWDYYDFHSVLSDRKSKRNDDITNEDTADKGYVNYEVRADYNSENDWYFPTRGARFHGRFAYYSDNFVKLNDKVGLREYTLIGRVSFPVSQRISVQPTLYTRSLYYDGDTPFLMCNMIGGQWQGHYLEQQMPFAGVGNVELTWERLVVAQLQAQYNLSQNSIIQLRVAGGQNAPTFEELLKHKTMLGASASYYLNTMFGPLGGSIGYSNQTKKFYYYINLGFVF